MNKTDKRGIVIFSIIVYIFAAVAMVLGTLNDVKIDIALFNPENSVARFAEAFGQFVYWGMWGIAFTVIFLCRRSLNESLEVVSRLLPFIKTVQDTGSKLYKAFDFIYKALTTIAFFVLAVVGWKKLIENVTKNILIDMGKDDLSQLVYFAVSAVVAVIAILVCSKISKQSLRKLEALALVGVLLGIFYKIVEECKTITNRVRFREMVAYSNGFLNEKGLSEGKHSPLTSAMAQNTDFSAFTPWYRIGDDMGIYNRSDSFPSGHTTYSCTMFLSYILCRSYDKLKKFAPLALCLSFAYTVAIAYTRLVAGAHYLTDVAGAFIIGYTLFLVVYKLYNSFIQKGIIGK